MPSRASQPPSRSTGPPIGAGLGLGLGAGLCDRVRARGPGLG
jgi:hypothetical protein